MSELDKFIDNLNRQIGKSRQAQLRFATCQSVDWEDKTMTAIGVSDEDPYQGVLLGFGYTDVKPAVDSVCLIGILEGKEALSFLINAEDVELVEIKAGQITFNDGENDGLVKVEKLTDKLNAIEKAFNQHLNNYKNHNHNHPQGTTTGLLIPDTQQTLAETKQADIKNDKINH